MNRIAGNTEVNRMTGAEDWLEHTVRTLLGAVQEINLRGGGAKVS